MLCVWRTALAHVRQRFLIHKSINRLAAGIVEQYGLPETEKAMLFPSNRCADRCMDFLLQYNPEVDPSRIRILEFVPAPETTTTTTTTTTKFVKPRLSAVIYPKELWPTAKAFWQHTGEGVSSRRAEFCQRAWDEKTLVEASSVSRTTDRVAKGPRRYQKFSAADTTTSSDSSSPTPVDSPAEPERPEVPLDTAQFVEERFGRNLDLKFASQAKLAVRQRIAGCVTGDDKLLASSDDSPPGGRERSRDVPDFTADDIYLFPAGMNAMYHSHIALRSAIADEKCIMYGFPYVDTLKVLEKFGAGAIFYGHGNAIDLDALQEHLKEGERCLALFCEFPGNPLLQVPDIERLRQLADEYDFALVVDETIGNFLNVHVLPYADMVVTSLTKLFSGDANVMGGAMMLRPGSRYYSRLKHYFTQHYEDNTFEEDAIYLERNSRDFIARSHRINVNAEVLADLLRAHPKIKSVNYPKFGNGRQYYDACRTSSGGYGGLLSATFHRLEDAQVFYDVIDTQKGPSLGTNFTLTSPFVLLAHYGELEWARQYGCELGLLRFSVGLEETEGLKQVFERALAAIL